MDQFKSNIPNIANNPESGRKKEPWWNLVAKVCALGALVAAGFIYGFSVGNIPNASVQQDDVIKYTAEELIDIFKDNEDVDVELFTEVWDILHDEYLDKKSI